MIPACYWLGLRLMRWRVPGVLTLGALLIRFVRMLDPDDMRQDQMWCAACAAIEASRARYNQASR